MILEHTNEQNFKSFSSIPNILTSFTPNQKEEVRMRAPAQDTGREAIQPPGE